VKSNWDVNALDREDGISLERMTRHGIVTSLAPEQRKKDICTGKEMVYLFMQNKKMKELFD
jgi:hypothetical protein